MALLPEVPVATVSPLPEITPSPIETPTPPDEESAILDSTTVSEPVIEDALPSAPEQTPDATLAVETPEEIDQEPAPAHTPDLLADLIRRDLAETVKEDEEDAQAEAVLLAESAIEETMDAEDAPEGDADPVPTPEIDEGTATDDTAQPEAPPTDTPSSGALDDNGTDSLEEDMLLGDAAPEATTTDTELAIFVDDISSGTSLPEARFAVVSPVVPANVNSLPSDAHPLEATESSRQAETPEGGFPWSGAVMLFVLFAVLCAGGWWGINILTALSRKKHYRDAPIEDQPSVNERLLSELTTLQVALLRSDAEGFYEKVYSLMLKLLVSRDLIKRTDINSEALVKRLHEQEVDAAFFDCVESIAQRCDAVRFKGERPTHDANNCLIRDLGTLIRMRPHTVASSHPDAPPPEA